MRRHKFILITICILLAGALTASLAANAIITPKTGKIISAGVLPVPSVLGQSADELRFYPWSMYDTQSLSLISDFYTKQAPETPNILVESAKADGWLDLLDAIQILGVTYDQETMLNSLLWNVNDYGTISAKGISIQIFLKNFPAQYGDSPVVVDFAYNQLPTPSVSYLVRPAQTLALTQNQQESALARVKADLMEFLFFSDPLENDLNTLLTELFRYYEMCESRNLTLLTSSLTEWKELLDSVPYEPGETSHEHPVIEDILADLEISGPYNIQLVSTPQQIIILFHRDNGDVLGIYYDIFLKCYTGFGISV